MRRTLGGSSTGPPGVSWQLPFVHVPAQGRLQPPRWSVSLMTWTQAFAHNIWPEAGQPQVPPLHTEPAGHWLPHEPQLSALLVVFTHAPVEHSVSPVPHIAWHELLLHTWP